MLKRPSNKVLYFVYTILYTTGFMFCSGTILQTFMISAGLSETTISAYNAVIQFVQAAVIFVMAFVADKIKKVLKVYALIILSITIIAVGLVFCVFVRSDLTAVKLIIFGSSIVAYLMIGIRNAVDYRIFYEIFDMKELGRLMGIAIAVSGLVSFGVSAAYSYAVSNYDYYDVMIVFFILSAVMILISFVASYNYKKVNETPQIEQKPGLELSAFKNKVTLQLAVPGFFRGFSSGIFALITVVGFSGGILNIETATYVSLITQLTSFAGNIVFSLTNRKIRSSAAVLISSVMLGIALPLSIVTGNLIPFLIFYAITNFAYVIINVSIPILVCEIVPYDQIGSFTCIRMMIYTLGSVVASIVYKPLADLIGYLWLFILAGILQVICGVAHLIVANSIKREQERKCN